MNDLPILIKQCLKQTQGISFKGFTSTQGRKNSNLFSRVESEIESARNELKKTLNKKRKREEWKWKQEKEESKRKREEKNSLLSTRFRVVLEQTRPRNWFFRFWLRSLTLVPRSSLLNGMETLATQASTLMLQLVPDSYNTSYFLSRRNWGRRQQSKTFLWWNNLQSIIYNVLWRYCSTIQARNQAKVLWNQSI